MLWFAQSVGSGIIKILLDEKTQLFIRKIMKNTCKIYKTVPVVGCSGLRDGHKRSAKKHLNLPNNRSECILLSDADVIALVAHLYLSMSVTLGTTTSPPNLNIVILV